MQQTLVRLTFRAGREMESYRKWRLLPTSVPLLDTLLIKQKQRYCLFSSVQGYTRTSSNYRGQIAIALGVGLLSMGMLVPTADKANTRVS